MLAKLAVHFLDDWDRNLGQREGGARGRGGGKKEDRGQGLPGACASVLPGKLLRFRDSNLLRLEPAPDTLSSSNTTCITDFLAAEKYIIQGGFLTGPP